MQNPSDTNSLRDFAEWKEKCDIKGQAYCSLPNACPLTTRELPGNRAEILEFQDLKIVQFGRMVISRVNVQGV